MSGAGTVGSDRRYSFIHRRPDHFLVVGIPGLHNRSDIPAPAQLHIVQRSLHLHARYRLNHRHFGSRPLFGDILRRHIDGGRSAANCRHNAICVHRSNIRMCAPEGYRRVRRVVRLNCPLQLHLFPDTETQFIPRCGKVDFCHRLAHDNRGVCRYLRIGVARRSHDAGSGFYPGDPAICHCRNAGIGTVPCYALIAGVGRLYCHLCLRSPPCRHRNLPGIDRQTGNRLNHRNGDLSLCAGPIRCYSVDYSAPAL